MSTTGLITVMKNGQVKYKFVAGCNGFNARWAASKLLQLRRITLDRAFRTVLAAQFGSRESYGCKDCLVAMTRTKVRKITKQRLTPSYRRTFDQPKWYPDSGNGQAEHTVIIDIS